MADRTREAEDRAQQPRSQKGAGVVRTEGGTETESMGHLGPSWVSLEPLTPLEVV